MGRGKEKRSQGLHFTRGLRTHRYDCVALRAFGKWEEEKKKEVGAYILRGAYASIAIIVSPFGLFGKWEDEKKKEVVAYI